MKEPLLAKSKVPLPALAKGDSRSVAGLLMPLLEGASGASLYKQIYTRLREAVLNRSLSQAMRLPSTRSLAANLGISRNTVLTAFEQLLAEGYLETRRGSGTYVAHILPEDILHYGQEVSSRPAAKLQPPVLSRRGKLLASTCVSLVRSPQSPRPFRPGVPAFDCFPWDLWTKLCASRARQRSGDLLAYGDPAGYKPLREALATYLTIARGVRCVPDQIVVLSGSQQALDLLARLLLDPGDMAWIEDPGYLGARGALLGAGARLIPIPVDKEGMDVSQGIRRFRKARLAYVSPSHQFPMGIPLDLARRIALLEWAHSAESWIIEDDYDSQYRYGGRPLATLHGLDQKGKVIYVGTLSKLMFPALRIGYIVAPESLVDAVISARSLTDRHAPDFYQAVMAEFIHEGHFARHIRRMRKIYAERQEALLQAASEYLKGLLDLRPAESGMHLTALLPDGVDDQAICSDAAANDIEVQAVSSYCLGPNRRGLLLGYSGYNVRQIYKGIRRLAAVLENTSRNRMHGWSSPGLGKL